MTAMTSSSQPRVRNATYQALSGLDPFRNRVTRRSCALLMGRWSVRSRTSVTAVPWLASSVAAGLDRPLPVEGREIDAGLRQDQAVVRPRFRCDMCDQGVVVRVQVRRADRTGQGERDDHGGCRQSDGRRSGKRCRRRLNAGREEAYRHRKREDVDPAAAQWIERERAGDEACGEEGDGDQTEEPGFSPRQEPTQSQADEGYRAGDRSWPGAHAGRLASSRSRPLFARKLSIAAVDSSGMNPSDQ